MTRSFCRSAAPALAALVLLGGCTTYQLGRLTLFNEDFKQRYGWTEEKMLRDGWLEARLLAPAPIYCYRTLGAPECYRVPQRGQEGRLVGFFDNAAQLTGL